MAGTFTHWMIVEECTKKVSKLFSKGTATKTSAELVSASIGNLRKLIRTELSDEIKEIDGLVRGILNIHLNRNLL